MNFKHFASFFLNFDIFTLPISLYYKGKKKRSTYLGVLLSLCIYIVLMFSFITSDFFKKENPIIVTQNKKYSHAQRISFDDTRMITISVVDNMGNAISDPTMFSFQFVIIKERVNLTTGLFEYISLDYKKLHLCTLNDTGNNTAIYNELSPLNAYCLENKTFGVEGGWAENDIEFGYIVLNICNNQTSDVTCKTLDQIENFFSSPRFFCVQYHSAQVDYYDYNNPIKIEYHFGIPQINFGLTKKMFLFLKQVQLTTDQGWFYPSYVENKDIMFDSSDNDFVTRMDNRLFVTQIYASQYVEVDTRRYQKLPEIVASVIGMAKIFVIFFSFIANFLNNFNTMKVLLTRLNIVKFGKRHKKVRLPKNTVEMRNSISMFRENRNFVEPKPGIGDERDKTKNFIEIQSFCDSAKEKKEKNNIDNEDLMKKKTIFQTNDNNNHQKNQSYNIDTSSINPKLSNFMKMSRPLKTLENIKNNINEREIPIEIPNEMKVLKTIIDTENSRILTPELSPNKTCRNEDLKSSKFAEEARKSVEKMNKLSLWEYIWYKYMSFVIKPDNFDGIKKIEKTFVKQLDLIKILTKLQDIEKLKKILLDEDQLAIFDFLGKPAIELEENQKNQINFSKKKYKKDKFLLSYNKMLLRLTEVDKRLILLAEENIDNS